ncbi:MAG: hypothetical protein K0R49_681 [Burkholderiales bacterium]|jgi:hypothetical protein|nr:hypothetical protein [Burkholderiales bacterium]
MEKNIIKIWLSIFLILVTGSIWAIKVNSNGVSNFPPTIQVAGQSLILNGSGIRKKLFFKVYELGLYVPKKDNDPNRILKMSGPKLVEIHMLRTVDAKTFVDALHDGLNDNNSVSTLKTLKVQMAKLESLMNQGEKAKKGDIIKFEFNPASGTLLSINGNKLGVIDDGAGFYNAILNIWLGPDPVDKGLKIDILNN